jgi:hypothetical protein
MESPTIGNNLALNRLLASSGNNSSTIPAPAKMSAFLPNQFPPLSNSPTFDTKRMRNALLLAIPDV